MGLTDILQAMECKAAEEIARMDTAAEDECRKIIEAAENEAERVKESHHAKAMARFRREAARISGAARSERQRQLAAVREHWLDLVRARAEQKLTAMRANPAYGRVYEQLCREALGEFNSSVKFEIDPHDGELMEQTKAALGVDGEIVSCLDSVGGLRVRSADGGITLDNTLEARLANGWKQLRPQLAHLLSAEEESCPATTATPTRASAL